MGERVVQPAGPADPSNLTPAVAMLFRWELAGGMWRVLDRDEGELTIGLFSCDAGEEMERFTSADEQLLAVVGERSTSEA
jgi:hypothetical protein